MGIAEVEQGLLVVVVGSGALNSALTHAAVTVLSNSEVALQSVVQGDVDIQGDSSGVFLSGRFEADVTLSGTSIGTATRSDFLGAVVADGQATLRTFEATFAPLPPSAAA